jgi:hypothetical protein
VNRPTEYMVRKRVNVNRPTEYMVRKRVNVKSLALSIHILDVI